MRKQIGIAMVVPLLAIGLVGCEPPAKCLKYDWRVMPVVKTGYNGKVIVVAENKRVCIKHEERKTS